MALGRDQIFAAKDTRTEHVKVDEWGGEVIVRSLSGAERGALEDRLNAVTGEDSKAGIRRMAIIIVAAVVDEQGQPVFTDDDLDAICAKGFKPIRKVYRAATDLNLLTDADVEGHAKN